VVDATAGIPTATAEVLHKPSAVQCATVEHSNGWLENAVSVLVSLGCVRGCSWGCATLVNRLAAGMYELPRTAGCPTA